MLSPSLRTGLLLATAVTLLLNASSLVILATGPRAALERKTDAMDEHYYLALIREAAEGHTALGSPSLREHRDDPSVVRYLMLIPGTLMRIFDLRLGTVLLLMDLLFPFLTTLFLFLAFRGIFKDTLTAAAAAPLALSVWHGGLLNVMNPKMIIAFLATYLALIFGVEYPGRRHFLLRGAVLGMLLSAYPHFFLFFLAFEGCDFLRRLRHQKSMREPACDFAFLLVPCMLLSLPWLRTRLAGGMSEAALDLWHRIVIESRLPADPRMQLLLLLTLVALFFVRTKQKRAGSATRESDLLLVCIAAGFLVLNQSLLHGLDIMFASHYRLLLTLILLLTTLFCAHTLLGDLRVSRAAFGLLALLSIAGMGREVFLLHQQRLLLARTFASSNISGVIERFRTEPEERVILAPAKIADLIPIFTSHYVAWNGYAHFQSATDAELAQRYVLQELVEPQKEEERDRSYPQIFSVHAGNLAARARTWCRWKSLLRKGEEECRVPVRDMIRHQDVLKKLEEDLAHRSPQLFLDLLQKFHVDAMVADRPLPSNITAACPPSEVIGKYTIYVCS